tara:strand:+ start:157 stop:315 length:159 start_codon:yes stop_codon:yes gene_type:complete
MDGEEKEVTKESLEAEIQSLKDELVSMQKTLEEIDPEAAKILYENLEEFYVN